MSMTLMLDPALSHAAAAPLACVLLLGAWDKLREPLRWQAVLEDHQLLPAPLLAPFAWLLPGAEALAGAALLPLATRGTGAWAALALLLLLSAAVAINLARGRTDIDCGCGGPPTPLSPGLLLRNAALVLLALLAACPLTDRALTALDMAAVAGATLFGLGLYLLANALLGQRARLAALRQGHRH